MKVLAVGDTQAKAERACACVTRLYRYRRVGHLQISVLSLLLTLNIRVARQLHRTFSNYEHLLPRLLI